MKLEMTGNKLPLLFQSLDRIDGQEGRSKLLHNESALYCFLKKLKAEISKDYEHKGDRMDLHIQITKQQRDPDFCPKAEKLQATELDLSDSKNWGYIGRAFVLWTPEIEGYGPTHITVTFFGNYTKPSLKKLLSIVNQLLEETT